MCLSNGRNRKVKSNGERIRQRREESKRISFVKDRPGKKEMKKPDMILLRITRKVVPAKIKRAERLPRDTILVPFSIIINRTPIGLVVAKFLIGNSFYPNQRKYIVMRYV